MDSTPKISIVVPVCNEALVLSLTVPALLAAAREEQAQVLWVCNGCTDDSFKLLQALVEGVHNAAVTEIADRGKTLALQAGDDHFGTLFPRFYVDADTWLRAGDLGRLCQALREGRADLVGPGHDFDCTGVTRVSAAIARCWLALPLGGLALIQGVMGVSQSGRENWGRWPKILGDDIFVSAMVPPARSGRVPDTIATSHAPADFPEWVRRRTRWRAGEAQLAALGLRLPSHPDQRRILLSRLLRGPERLGALAFIAARVAAAFSKTPTTDSWEPERQ
jgi:cellulose synthase/poly-beta-1,6-N-acetylglucosamine synthase-like glycosyltransferase